MNFETSPCVLCKRRFATTSRSKSSLGDDFTAALLEVVAIFRREVASVDKHTHSPGSTSTFTTYLRNLRRLRKSRIRSAGVLALRTRGRELGSKEGIILLPI
jgi:hypothetical protein